MAQYTENYYIGEGGECGLIRIELADFGRGLLALGSASCHIDGSSYTYSFRSAGPANDGYIRKTGAKYRGKFVAPNGETTFTDVLESGEPIPSIRYEYRFRPYTDTVRGTISLEEYMNVPPISPPTITVPTTVKGGEVLAISWGVSTDADGNLSGYTLERSINGGTYTQVYKGANRSFTDNITKGWNTVAYRVKAYDSEGAESGYTTSATRTVINNVPPIISGQDSNLGDKNTGFTVTYLVNDADTADNLTVKEKINGVTIKTLNNAPRNQEFIIEITEEMLYSYDLYATNTIEIEVNDGQGNVVYRRYTFKRTNTAPRISGQDEELGEKTEGFDITFSATDQENDTMSAKVYLNDRLVKTYEVIEPNQEYIYSLSKLDFVQLNNTDVHKIRIEVQDHNNATAIRNYTFTRKLDRIMYAFEKETDIMATQILISPTWHIAAGAVAQVLVCNNAFDEVPTWEDATEQVLLERHFNFINKEKTADKWGIGVQIIINKGTATELSFLAGFGGAYK